MKMIQHKMMAISKKEKNLLLRDVFIAGLIYFSSEIKGLILFEQQM